MGEWARPVIPQERETSRTYRLDLVAQRIVGMVDGQEAAYQAIVKRLMTEQHVHLIYGRSGYGMAIEDLVGQDRFIVEAELKRRLTESLLSDDRITRIHSLHFSGGLDDLLTQLAVDTIFGEVVWERRWPMA